MRRFPLLSKPSLHMSGRSFTIYTTEDEIHGVLGETIEARLTTKGVTVLFPDRDEPLSSLDSDPFSHPLAGGGVSDRTFTGRTFRVPPINRETLWFHPDPQIPVGTTRREDFFAEIVPDRPRTTIPVAPASPAIDWAAIGESIGASTSTIGRATERADFTSQAQVYADRIRRAMATIEDHRPEMITTERLAALLTGRGGEFFPGVNNPTMEFQFPRDQMEVRINNSIDAVTIRGNIVVGDT